MTGTELVVLTPVQVAKRREAIVTDQEAPAKTAENLMVIDQRSARALMIGLPTDRQHAVVLAACQSSSWFARDRIVEDCGTIIPIIDLLEPEQAATVFALDTTLFAPINEEEMWRQANSAGIDSADVPGFERFKADHTFLVRSPTGEIEERLLNFVPERAYAYLNTVIRHNDEDWRLNTLSDLADEEILALLMMLREDDELQVDEDEWEDFRDAYPEENWQNAIMICRREDREDLLERIVDAHRDAMEEAFRMAEDQVQAIIEEAATSSAMEDELDDV
jgi:hypothetical protein